MPAPNNDRVVRNVKYGPQAKDDTGSGLEDGVVLIDVLGNDLAGGANHLWSLDQADPGNFTGEGVPVTLASGATVHFDNDVVVYDPGSTFNNLALGEQATDTFTYAIRMANGVVSYATVTVTITGENDGPVAVADVAAATEDGALIAGNVGSNDSDADNGATLSFALDGTAPAGLTFGADGNWSFDPSHGDYQSLAAGETLDVVVSYTVTDEHGATDSATLTITVTGTNDAPVAAADAAAGLEHDTLTIDVLANDTDVDNGAVLSVVDASPPDGQGSVAIVGNQLVFDPGSDFDYLSEGQTATVTLGYTIADEHGAQSSSTVTVTVTGTNDAPIIGGGDFSGAVVEAEPVTGIPAGSTPILVETGDNDLFAGAQLIDRADLRIADNANLGDDSDPAISVQGQIDSATDQDVYSIQLQAGETITLDVDFGLGFGTVAYPGYLGTPGLDSFVSIYDSAGNLLNLNDDAPTGLGGAGSFFVQDSFLQFTAATPGTYYVVVHDYNDLGAMSQGPYTMQVSVDSQALQITDTGTLSFTDVDLADGHGVTVTPQDGGYLGTLSASVTDAATGDGAGTVRWDFSVANAAVQYLAEGQTLVQTYTVAVSDGAGGTDEESVTITITGTNDTPVITNALSIGDIVEGSQLSTGGQVHFTEVDLTDGHSVTSSADEGGYLGTFSANLADGATGDGSGRVDWTFDVDDAAIQHLAAGQWLLQRYTITIDDGHGGTTQQLVNVTITGTNDGVVIEAGGDASGSVTELPNASPGEGTAILGDSGSILFSDADTADLHAASFTNMGPDYLGSFSVNLDQGTDTVSWNFEVSDGALESLAAGEVLTQVYQVSVSDGQGGIATQDVTVTITGAADNSPPTITSSASEHEGSITAVATEAPGDNAPATELAASYLTAGNSLINGLGGSQGFGESLLARNDDGSTGFIDLSTIFGSAGLNFFGSTFNGLYINNNGNVTFNFPTFQYNPSVITGTTNNPTIAAFWDDVDTRNTNGQTSPGGTSTGTNLVYYDVDPVNGVFTVTWNDTGEYSNRNVPNAFQIQLIRRGNDGDFDIVLRYESVNWSTGARAGYTAGNGQDYFELPQSGSDPAMLALESTVGNTGIPGVFVFEVRDGQVFTGTHTEAGTISFADVDVTDTHSATVEALDDGYLGTLVLGAVNQGQNQVSWSFSVANDDLLGLAEGEVATQVYRVTISDGNGGTVSQDVTVTLTGRNDGPTATADTATGGENDVLTLDVLANDTDPDQGDQLSLVEASVADGQGSVSVVDNQLVFDPGTDFDHLEEGQTAIVEVAYTVADQHGVQTTANAEITVTGAAEGPPWADGDFNAAFVTGAGAPWGATSAYAGSMDTAFGAGEWDQLNAPSGNIFDDGYDFIWLDGGNGQTDWFESFVNEYRDEMEDYVSQGGTLYINAGRWDGTANFDLGFSVQITNNGFSSSGTATGDASELVNGPNGYAGTNWTGNYFSHDYLTGTGLTTLITGNGQTILAELDFGEGHVVFGGLTSSAFHDPDPQAAILEANILDHAASFAPDYFI